MCIVRLGQTANHMEAQRLNVAISTCPVTVYSLLYQPLDAIPIAENKRLRLSPGFCSEYSMK